MCLKNLECSNVRLFKITIGLFLERKKTNIRGARLEAGKMLDSNIFKNEHYIYIL